MLRWVFAVALGLAGSQGSAAAKGFKDQVIEGTRHEVEALTWRDELFRTESHGCLKSTPEDAVGCVRNTVRIHNESPLGLQCHVTLGLPAADEYDKTSYESDVVVFAGKTLEVFRSFGPIAFVPSAFASDCVAIPAAIEPLDVPAECRGKVVSPSISDFYPAGSLRREEQGSVSLEYGVEDGNRNLLDVRVVVSSGYEELDAAALRAARFSRTFDQCPGRRYRIRINFSVR
jgi:TonB family protein